MNSIFFAKRDSLIYSKQQINFKAGLTLTMLYEIQRTDALEISSRLAKKGIPTDFKNNKVIAWCCAKTVDILQQLNKQFKSKLALPKGIYVEDFNHLNVDDAKALGTCNLLLTELKKGSSDVTPSRVLFFNSIHNWGNINPISDAQYAQKQFSTDHFLYSFLHEFVHVAHEDKLLNKFGGTKLKKMLESLNEEKQLREYNTKYGSKVEQICEYAKTNPLEAIACDMPKIIVSCLDKETLIPTKNPFVGTPYERLHFWQKTPIDTNPLNKILRNFWDGKFD